MFGPCSPQTHDVRTTVAPIPAASASCSPASFEAPYTHIGPVSSHSVYGAGCSPLNT